MECGAARKKLQAEFAVQNGRGRIRSVPPDQSLPKSEIRGPKPEGSPKSEVRRKGWNREQAAFPASSLSGFGLRISFGFRASDFGFGRFACGGTSKTRPTGGAPLRIATLAASRLAGVSGARQREIRQIPVTLAALPLSIPYIRALRDATSLAGWTGLALGLGTGREREGGGFQQAYNRLATCLQLPCNYGPTLVLLRCCPGGTREPRLRSSSRKAALLRPQDSAPRGGTGKTRPNRRIGTGPQPQRFRTMALPSESG